MKLEMSGLRQLAWFLVLFAVLLLAYRYFPRLDNVLGIAFLALLLVAGVISLFRASSGKATMPSFVGALPKGWRRWVLGESDKPK
jgi:hypothetical protein